MQLICVGGFSSGCGKTSIACMLLKALPGWAAIKVTPSRRDEVCPRGHDCAACRPPDGPYEVTIDDDIPERPRKDTSRFVEAGASHVVFARAVPECIPAALESALTRLDGVPGVIIESTTAMPFINGPRILVAREGGREIKDSARAALGLADLLVVNQDAHGTVIPNVCEESAFDTQCLEQVTCEIVTACAALPPEHPRNRKLIDCCRSFDFER